MRRFGYLACLLSLLPVPALAQASAPELYGVQEVLINYARFDDVKKSDLCNLSRESVAAVLRKAFAGSGVPAIDPLDAKPLQMGVARVDLVPQISTYANENLDCVSWVSLSAEGRAILPVPPVKTPRSVTVVYWRNALRVDSGQGNHPQAVGDAIKKMAAQFAQQYRIDQPPVFSTQ